MEAARSMITESGFPKTFWAENRDDRESNSGYYISMNGGAISWSCRKQDIVALSSTEAEYVALSETCKEVMWIKQIASTFDIVMPSYRQPKLYWNDNK